MSVLFLSPISEDRKSRDSYPSFLCRKTQPKEGRWFIYITEHEKRHRDQGSDLCTALRTRALSIMGASLQNSWLMWIGGGRVSEGKQPLPFQCFVPSFFPKTKTSPILRKFLAGLGECTHTQRK